MFSLQIWFSPFRLALRPTTTIPQRFNEIKLKFCFALQWDGRNWWYAMLGCSFVNALQQLIFAHINICKSRIMHLKFLRCQQMFCCFSVKYMGCKPTLCLFFCEVVYRTGISDHWLLLFVQFWCCVIEIALVIWLHLQKSQLGEFPHIGFIANISSPHYAGPSSSTLYQSINLNWSDKQQPEALLA